MNVAGGDWLVYLEDIWTETNIRRKSRCLILLLVRFDPSGSGLTRYSDRPGIPAGQLPV